MKNKILVFFLLFSPAFTNTVTGQHDTVFFSYDKELNPCPRPVAIYFGIGISEKGKLRYLIYNASTGTPLFKGYFTDSTLKVKDGLFTYYDEEGAEGSEGVYINDKEEGYWREWRFGHLTDSVYYENGEEIIRIAFQYHPNDTLESRVLNNGRAKISEIHTYDSSGRLSRKAVWKDGNGDQVNYYTNGNIKTLEKYKKKVQVSTTYFREDGSEIPEKEYQKLQQRITDSLRKVMYAKIPEFPGGIKNLHSYFGRNFRPPASMAQQANLMEFISIQFYLDKKGYAYDIKVENSANLELLQAIQDLFRNMPPWNMKGLKNYGPFNYRFRLTNLPGSAN